jgi:hypothetical protein
MTLQGGSEFHKNKNLDLRKEVINFISLGINVWEREREREREREIPPYFRICSEEKRSFGACCSDSVSAIYCSL